VPEDGGLINQALIGLKPVNACGHTYTKPQTPSTRSRGLGWRIHESVEDTKLSTNKQHTLSRPRLPLRSPASTRTPLLDGSGAYCQAHTQARPGHGSASTGHRGRGGVLRLPFRKGRRFHTPALPEGQAISYSKWCPGQPDSSSTGYCGLIESESSGCWDDYACGQSRPFLCQMDPFGPCTLCPADTYREGPSRSSDTGNCISCPLGSSSPAGSTSRSNCTCNAESAACVGCAAGKYSTSPTNTIVCTSCPANKYSAAVGASFCAECEAGKYSAAGSTNASNCRVELRQWSKMDAAAGVTGTGPSAYQSYRMPPRHRYGTEWKMVSHNDNGGPRHLRLRRSH